MAYTFGMKVRETIDIEARCEDVWPLVADPARMAEWHVRLVKVERSANGPVRFGDRFGSHFQLSGKVTAVRSEVIRCQPPVALTLRHSFEVEGRERYGEDSYDLEPHGAGTQVVQTADFRGAGLPWWARTLMWVITRTGRTVGEGILEPLKRACEAGR